MQPEGCGFHPHQSENCQVAGFVSGHDFSRAENIPKKHWALAPEESWILNSPKACPQKRRTTEKKQAEITPISAQ